MYRPIRKLLLLMPHEQWWLFVSLIRPSELFTFSINLYIGLSGTALGYGLVSGVRVSARAGNFSLHHRVQAGSGAHPASYPVGTRGSFSEGKAAWA
jgi:hypothetical protein